MHELGVGEMRSPDGQEGFEDIHEMSDSFVVDIESLPSGLSCDINVTAKSNIMRSLSRKGTQQQKGEKKDIVSVASGDDGFPAPGSSPKVALIEGGCPLDMSPVVQLQIPAVNHSVTAPQAQSQQVLVKNKAENKWRRSSKQRATFSDPWRILFIFATLSSMGTILLIYLTLTISMGRIGENGSNSYS